MAKDKPQPQAGPALAGYTTKAKPKAYADGVPVFCAHDAIVPVKDLRPNPKNPNKHPPEQIKLLGSIIRATGWRGPITVSTRSGMIVKGHGRMMAAELDDLSEVPVDYQEYASEAEEMADLVADNRIAELSDIINKLLAEVFADIDTGEIPFMLSGYTEEEYGNIVTALSEAIHNDLTDPDAVIEPPAEPITQYGDLWIVGQHRVLCGDCTRPEDRALLLNGEKPEILLTDPPYCSGGNQESKKATGSIGTKQQGKPTPKIANDIISTRGYQNLIRAALTDVPCLYAYIFTDWRMWVYLFDLVEAAGLGVKSMLVWDKGSPGMGMGWRSQHELIMFAARASTSFDGHKGYGNVLTCQRTGNDLHPTQKPVELIEMPIDNTDFAEGVYDPFGGSGTTLIACESKGQKSYIMELTPAYTDVTVKRYIRTTGKKDVRCIRQGKELPREQIAGIFERDAEPDAEGGERE
jgi:DNA modification methylase